ncbi:MULTISPECIES: hypothetical protein [unclassified Halorubrum]|uniref:hypothetical protein n=1 Tax=unclassified Halorubrum TaxID=2642239 RepID=UPI00190A0FE3|nr:MULTISPECIES: hypothetical protein [unclassified Halorubrum]
MDDRERDEILWRLDERTERMDARVERIDNRQSENAEAIEDLDTRVTRNTTVLAGITFGLSSLLAAVIGKFNALFHLK